MPRCVLCDARFIASRGGQRYCGDRCRELVERRDVGCSRAEERVAGMDDDELLLRVFYLLGQLDAALTAVDERVDGDKWWAVHNELDRVQR